MGRWWSELGSVAIFALQILHISDIVFQIISKRKVFPKLVSTLTQEPTY